jgi:hypothetical protein
VSFAHFPPHSSAKQKKEKKRRRDLKKNAKCSTKSRGVRLAALKLLELIKKKKRERTHERKRGMCHLQTIMVVAINKEKV